MPRKPKEEKPMPPARTYTIEEGRKKARVMFTLDPATLATLEAVQAAHPEIESPSAAVRFLARQWSADVAAKDSKKNPR